MFDHSDFTIIAKPVVEYFEADPIPFESRNDNKFMNQSLLSVDYDIRNQSVHLSPQNTSLHYNLLFPLNGTFNFQFPFISFSNLFSSQTQDVWWSAFLRNLEQ